MIVKPIYFLSSLVCSTYGQWSTVNGRCLIDGHETGRAFSASVKGKEGPGPFDTKGSVKSRIGDIPILIN